MDEPTPDRAALLAALHELRLDWRRRSYARGELGPGAFPSRHGVDAAAGALTAALFPRRLGRYDGDPEHEDAFVAARLDEAFSHLRSAVAVERDYWQSETDEALEPDHADSIVEHFASYLPEIRSLVDSDVAAAFLGDPAARSVDEILICYPCALAVLHHRIAHRLHELGAVLVARILSEIANERTGIDIHPGARIGPGFFVDHGTGVVIGETSVIGANVRLYQHVTLGARRLLGDGEDAPTHRLARHPIVEDDVVIYAGATILGRVRIGRGSVIGGNVWLTRDVAANSVLKQAEALILDADSEALFDLD